MSLILISQKYLLDMLDPASMSTFRRANAITFDKYSADELRDIVADRVALALFRNVTGVRRPHRRRLRGVGGRPLRHRDPGEGRDARRGGGAKGSSRERAHRQGLHLQRRHRDQDRGAGHPEEARAAGGGPRLRDHAYVTTGEVEKAYRVAAEEHGEKPRGHTQFWAYLQQLSNDGLVKTKVTGDPSGGRTTYISVPDMPVKVLRERLEDMLSL